tara:strand:+ start:1186 stop:2820 length:1635 start_codon:yes stop_codon:yes gene_type:complete
VKLNIVHFILILVSSLFSQIDMNYSYELQYGDGQQVIGQASNNPQKEQYSYLQNILDINTYIGNNIYVFTQLEYSKPPIYGYDRTSLDSTITSFYVEFSNDRINMKIGDQYELYGRGLAYYSFQDQNIDYDNSVIGFSLGYYINDNLKFSTLFGSNNYAFRSNPVNRQTDYEFETDVGLGVIDYENYLLGSFQSVIMMQKSRFSGDLLMNLCLGDNEISDSFSGSCIPLNGMIDDMKLENYNLNWSYLLGPFDIYFDKSWIYYDKLLADKEFGSRFYSSIYFELFEAGITYEHKNYYTPYLLKSLSNPPIAYREGSSILASRNSHSMNFGNEIGHQLEINKSISEAINMTANFSMSYRHEGDGMEPINFNDILSMKADESIQGYYPFRQIYVELNGWTLSDQLYYKIGLDHFMEYANNKNITAMTVPTQSVLEFQNGSSLTMYLEIQNKTVDELGSEFEYDNQYLSASYSHKGKLIFTCFFDQEIKEGKTGKWLGSDMSWKINTKSMVSLFYGSQKGGLVCANGICAEQPGFEDGMKLTLRTLF